MGSTYNYSLFVRIKDSKSGKTPESAPKDLLLVVEPLEKKGGRKGWSILVPLGMNRTKLVDLLEWLEEIKDNYDDGFELFDPQQGDVIDPAKDGDELIEEIIKHDNWILDNIGGDATSNVPVGSSEMAGRTKLMIWFAVIIVGLYFLTRCSLSLYFS